MPDSGIDRDRELFFEKIKRLFVKKNYLTVNVQVISLYLCDIFFALCTCKNPCDNQHQNSEPLNKVRHAPWYEQNKNLKVFGKGILNSNSFGSCFKYIISFKIFWHFYSVSGTYKAWKEEKQSTILETYSLYIRNAHFNTITNSCQTAVKWITETHGYRRRIIKDKF